MERMRFWNRWVTGLLGPSRKEHLRDPTREVGLTGSSHEVILAGEVPEDRIQQVDREIVLLMGLRTLLLGISMAEEVAGLFSRGCCF